MPKQRFTLIPEVYLILIQDGRILLSRRFQTGYEDGNYSLVAGHADGGETMREAMAREALEEAGLTISPRDLNHAVTLHRWCGDHERIGFFFTPERWRGEIENSEPNKCDDLGFFVLDRLPANIIPYISHVIGCYQQGIPYSEFGWERER
ncbi:MAG: NUDIX domain-containing protein [bacterium]|nr:NUDIX domain-containing protein [bacterium]